LLGTIAAFIEGIILQPTAYWKNAKAQNLPFTLDPRLLYRGTAAAIFNECQMMGLQFGFTGFFQKMFQKDSTRKLTRTQEFASAGIGGVCAAFFASPVELIMIQQQKYGGSFFNTPMRIVKNHGLLSAGMMRGVLATAGRDCMYTCGMLGVTPIMQEYLLTNHNMSLSAASFYASMIGGVVAAVPSHPFDCIKTCMQGDAQRVKYDTFVRTARTLYQEAGVRRLFNGVMWRTVNITMTVYIANECINALSPYIRRVEI